MPGELRDQLAGRAVPVVDCPETFDGNGVPGSDPSQFGRKKIHIMQMSGENQEDVVRDFSLEVDGPNDPDVVAATAKFAHLKIPPAEMATAVYRDAADAKAARAARQAAVTRRVAPRPAAAEADPGPAAEAAPGVVVGYAMADGGEMTVEYENAVIAGDTLALIEYPAATRSGSYTPPKSEPGALRPVTVRVGDLPGEITAHRIQDAYVAGGRRHLVFLIDRR